MKSGERNKLTKKQEQIREIAENAYFQLVDLKDYMLKNRLSEEDVEDIKRVHAQVREVVIGLSAMVKKGV